MIISNHIKLLLVKLLKPADYIIKVLYALVLTLWAGVDLAFRPDCNIYAIEQLINCKAVKEIIEGIRAVIHLKLINPLEDTVLQRGIAAHRLIVEVAHFFLLGLYIKFDLIV